MAADLAGAVTVPAQPVPEQRHSPATASPRSADDALAARPERPLARERAALAALAISGAVILPGALNRFVFPKLAVVAARGGAGHDGGRAGTAVGGRRASCWRWVAPC